MASISTYNFTYRVASGAIQSFRCAAADHAQAVRLFAEERKIVRAVTGGTVTPLAVQVVA